MSNNPEKDAIRAEARKREIMDAAFRVFTERSIDKVTMNDVADAGGDRRGHRLSAFQNQARPGAGPRRSGMAGIHGGELPKAAA